MKFGVLSERVCSSFSLLFVLGFFHFTLGEENFKCPEQFGYYPDFQDCSKYYICVFGDSLHEKCTGGLFFSVELQTCDWPRNVECANGNKPGEPAAGTDFDEDDEVFSSSRHTSATAGEGRPRQPNPEPVSNYQQFENKDEPREYTRNRQQNQRSRTTSVSSPAPDSRQPKVATPTTAAPRQKQEPNPTTLPDRLFNAGENDPSTAEDPLYLSDERSKVSDPLGNYDPQQPDFDEAAPPLVDSEGGIHIADGGHGLDAFAGLAHLPGLGDYSVIAKPVYNVNSGTSDRLSDEDEDYNREEKLNPASRNQGAVSTKPRSLENYQSANNGRSKDPDIIVDYSSDNKDLQWNRPNSKTDEGTPLPTIFDDNADQRDYGRFDITPLKTNIQAEHDPAGSLKHIDKNQDTQNGRKYNSEEISISVAQPSSDTRRINSNDRVRTETVRANNPAFNENSKDRATIIGESVVKTGSVRSRGQPGDVSFTVINGDLSRFPAGTFDPERQRDKSRIVDYGALSVYRPPKEHLNFQANRNAQSGVVDEQRSDRRPAESEENSNQRQNFQDNQRRPQNPNVAVNTDRLPSSVRASQPSNSEPEYNRKRLNDQKSNPYPEISRNNGDSKDIDIPVLEHALNTDFGTYTGTHRQNRKIDGGNSHNQETDSSKTIIPAESIQPSVRQPNNIQRNPQPKDQSIDNENYRQRNPPYRDEYDELNPNYGEYDSSKPLYTDEYYTNNEEQETTTRSTAQGARSRPTRPRRPITTTTTTTTTTTPAPIRVRSRKPISQVSPPTKQPNYYATTPASFPSRPLSLYPTPIPYTNGQKCDPRKCKLPDCRCGGIDIPGELTPEETPQIVVLTFDDAVNDLNHDLYNELFNTGRVNPNGCPILGTFYVSHEWTDYGQVQTLYSEGHEIASHSITHSYGEKFSKNQWLREIQGQREILHLYGGVKMEDIRGMRAPFLQIGGNKMFEMLYDSNFTYDSSMPVYENNPPFWPYTLDYALNHECMIFPCPSKSYPGMWEVGMVMWVDLRGGRCSMGDACSNPPDEEAVAKMLMKNFNRHYKTNKSPFGLFYHSAWFNTQHHRRGFMKFLNEILKHDDVYLVTNWQLIEWMRNPAPISKIKDFEPFNCRRMDRPPPCPSPTVCNVWYQGGVRYMKTCQPCPVKYPWIGSTGYDAKNKG